MGLASLRSSFDLRFPWTCALGVYAVLPFLMPTQAWAAACDTLRPGWAPGTSVSAFDEMLALFGTPPSLVLVLATALALRFRHKWAGLAVVVLWSTWLTVVAVLGRGGEIQQMAVAEGCLGPPTLFILAVAAICVATVLYTSPRNTRL